MHGPAMAPSFPDLLFNIDDPSCVWHQKASALRELQDLGTDAEGCFPSLRTTLSDTNLRVRSAGAQACSTLSIPEVWGRLPGKMGSQVLPELARCMSDVDSATRRLAREPFNELKVSGHLGEVGVGALPVVPDLIRQLQDEDWRIRESAARVFSELGPTGIPACSALVRLIADESNNCREMAKSSLDNLVDVGFVAADLRVIVPPSAQHLRKQLKHKNWKVKCAAAWALGTGATGAVMNAKRLAEFVQKDPNQHIRILAVEVLGRLGLACLPALPVLANIYSVLKTTAAYGELKKGTTRPTDAALMKACYDTMYIVRSEMVSIIGKAMPKHHETQKAVEKAQRAAIRFGCDTQFEREIAIKQLCTPSSMHIAAVTEMLRVLLDPSCPGAQAEGSWASAAEAIQATFDASLLGAFDTENEGTNITSGLIKLMKDRKWRVRLAAAGAAASQAAFLVRPVARIQHHVEGEDEPMRLAAQRVSRVLQRDGACLDPIELAKAAAPELRYVNSHDFVLDCEGVPIPDLVMAQKVAREALKKIIQSKLVEQVKTDILEDPAAVSETGKASPASPKKKDASAAFLGCVLWLRVLSRLTVWLCQDFGLENSPHLNRCEKQFEEA